MVEVEGGTEDLGCDKGQSKRLSEGDGKHHTSGISSVGQTRGVEEQPKGRRGRA